MFNGNSFNDCIQKRDSSNFILSGTIPVQTKTASSDRLEKGNNSEAFCASCLDHIDIASAKDSIDVTKIDNDDAWEWIHENIGVIQEVTGDGNCGYRSFISACNRTKITFGIDLPKMR